MPWCGQMLARLMSVIPTKNLKFLKHFRSTELILSFSWMYLVCEWATLVIHFVISECKINSVIKLSRSSFDFSFSSRLFPINFHLGAIYCCSPPPPLYFITHAPILYRRPPVPFSTPVKKSSHREEGKMLLIPGPQYNMCTFKGLFKLKMWGTNRF